MVKTRSKSEECQNIWKSLKDKYCRERKALERRLASGAAADDTSLWEWYSELNFLMYIYKNEQTFDLTLRKVLNCPDLSNCSKSGISHTQILRKPEASTFEDDMITPTASGKRKRENNTYEDVNKILMVRYRRCAIVGCTDKTSTRHRFPNPEKDKTRYDEWIRICGNPKLLNLSPATVYLSQRVCHTHFPESDRTSNMYIKKTSLPILHVPDVTSKLQQLCYYEI
ncbi:hypothetical protein FQR65_LT15494 [Abscondita terminalis]|nr:hypothetical protein FQR65_LT15494 [Abscondita terminalis]